MLSSKNRFENFWNFDPWGPQFWSEQKNDRNDFEMIFRELSNAAFRFSLRRPGAEIMGGGAFKRPPPPSRRWKIQRPGRARVKLWMAPCFRNLFIHMAIADLPGVVTNLQLKRLLKAFGCPDRTEFWPTFPQKRPSVLSVYRIVINLYDCTLEYQWKLQASSPLHVHVDLLFCKLWLILRDCFHSETFVTLKMCPFLHIFFRGTVQLLYWTALFEIFTTNSSQTCNDVVWKLEQYNKEGRFY